MQLNGNDVETTYNVELIRHEHEFSRSVYGDFGSGRYIGLDDYSNGGRALYEFMVKGESEHEFYSKSYALAFAFVDATIKHEGSPLNYKTKVIKYNPNFIGLDGFDNGSDSVYFGTLILELIVYDIYSDIQPVENNSTFSPLGAGYPYIVAKVKNNSSSTIDLIKILGLENEMHVGPLTAGQEIIVDGMDATVKIAGVNSIDKLLTSSFLRAEPLKQYNVYVSPSTDVQLTLSYYARWM